ncbi:hypothetical protein MRB53_025532 [Persea americana]|uniref:Uncharacterized protein n=1 Tax=Persea americana TaxID=3435 RepID=A0ACC2LG44_PERAE|nr:hypothetical protein MRB53_025532 [Persea americana]
MAPDAADDEINHMIHHLLRKPNYSSNAALLLRSHQSRPQRHSLRRWRPARPSLSGDEKFRRLLAAMAKTQSRQALLRPLPLQRPTEDRAGPLLLPPATCSASDWEEEEAELPTAASPSAKCQ